MHSNRSIQDSGWDKTFLETAEKYDLNIGMFVKHDFTMLLFSNRIKYKTFETVLFIVFIDT